MQLELFLRCRFQVSIEGRNNLDEAWHNEGKEANTSQHDKDREHLFNIWNGVQVTVADRGQSSNTEVADGDKLENVADWIIMKPIFCEESQVYSFFERGDKVE